MDRRAFEQQVFLYQEPLRRFLLHLCRGDAALCDDLAQEAFIKAYLNLNSFHGRSGFSTWLFRIAFHCFCDNRKASRRFSFVEVDEKSAVASELADHHFDHQELYLALDKLNIKERSILLLFYMEEKSLKEISCIIDSPVNTVKSRLSRGREHIAGHLKAMGYERR